jgi:ankyrin repeat protein
MGVQVSCSICIDNNFAIRSSCSNGSVETVKLLLADARVDPSASNNNAFEYSVYNGHLEVVRLLLNDSRVNPDAVTYYRTTGRAYYYGHRDIAILLLRDYYQKMRFNPLKWLQ